MCAGVCWRRSGELKEGRVVQGAVCGFGKAVPRSVVEEGGMERKTKEKTTIFQEAKACLAVLFLLSLPFPLHDLPLPNVLLFRPSFT